MKYYVSILGNNKNEGTELKPFKTVNYSLSKMSEDDTLVALDGSLTLSKSKNKVKKYITKQDMGLFFGLIGQTYNSSIIGTCPISHDQFYLIPQNAINSDYVGQFCVNKVDKIFNTRVGNYSYSIIAGNYSNIFAINSTTGLISINDNSNIIAGDVVLTIAVSIGSITETYTATVKTIATANCHFSDFDTGISTNPGTRDSPKKYLYDWNGIQVTGHAYFIKRGTTEIGGAKAYMYVNGLYFSAYGQGNIPKITTKYIRIGQWATTNGISNQSIYDIELVNSEVEVITGAYNNQFHRLTISGAPLDGGIYQYGPDPYIDSNSKVYDCTSYNSTSHGFKLGRGYTVLNAEVYGNARNGITSQGGACIFSYLYSYNNLIQYGIELDYGDNLVDYSVFDGNNNNVMFAFGTVNNNEINNNNIVKRSIIQNGINSQIYVESGGILTNTCANNTIDKCIVRNSSSNGINLSRLLNNTVIKNCYIYNNLVGINILSFGELVTSQLIHHNVIYNNGTGVNIGNYTGANTILIDHNTVLDNTIDITFSTSDYIISLRNTIYKIITNLNYASTQLTNYVASDNSNFVDRPNNNYHIVLGAVVRGAGTNLGYTTDIDNKKILNPPSIGAFEFIN